MGKSISSIGERTFYGCSGFTGSLTIPDSVTEIGRYAFQFCSGFTGDLNIGNSVTKIGNYAFSHCSGFTGNLTLGNSITIIGHSAFYWCSGLQGNLTIGDSVTKIESNAFALCYGFNGRLTIPESVTAIEQNAFRDCRFAAVNISSLEAWCKIDFEDSDAHPLTPENNLYLNGELLTELIIPESITEIKNYTFMWCTCITGNLAIPESITSIGKYAFYGCNGFTGNLTIPNSVTAIEDYAFYGCNGFTGDLTIPNSVTAIGIEAFRNCSGLTGTLTIGNSVTKIYGGAFYNCKGFTQIKSLNSTPPNIIISVKSSLEISDTSIPLFVPDESINLYKSAWGWKDFYKIYPLSGSIETTIGGITYEVIPGGGENGEDVVKVIGGDPDDGGTLRIPDEIEIDGKKYPVTEIGEGAFKDRTDIKRLIIPASVIKIGNEAFAGCTNLNEVVAEDGSKILNCGTDAFKNAPVKTLYLGRDTTGKSFAGNNYLTDLTIGEKVTSIGVGDFGGCNSIKEITVLAENPPTLSDNGFEQGIYRNAILIVPVNSLDIYKNSDGWKNFFNITTGIYGVDSDGKGIVRVEGGEIVIESDGKAEIFNISGVRVSVSSGGRVSGLPRGIYIVRIGGKTVKIKL